MDRQNKKTHRWESWPFKLIYFPLSFVWAYFIIRSRAVWFFTPSNPTITFGGLEGEPKREMYEQLPQHLYPATFNVQPNEQLDDILPRLRENNIVFPFVVKPEVGWAGLLFRKIDTLRQLSEYHEKVKLEYIVQNLIQYPIEVSVFYYRMPNEKIGTISGFLHKVPLHVIGNGKSTLLQLIHEHPKTNDHFDVLNKVHNGNFNKIIPAGEKYPLSYAANHNRGAQFINLEHEIDNRLLKVFDKLSFQVSGWYYGRYDIMCSSVEDLKAGKNFEILEFNGAGAEPNHIYDSGYTLLEAYKEILKHWKVLYKISRYNHKQGIPYWSFNQGRKFLKDAKKHLAEMKRLEQELSF